VTVPGAVLDEPSVAYLCDPATGDLTPLATGDLISVLDLSVDETYVIVQDGPRGQQFCVVVDRLVDQDFPLLPYPALGSTERAMIRPAPEGDGLVAYLAAVEEALADEGDPWAAFARFMRRVVDADTHSLTSKLAGTFTPTDELNRDAATAQELNQRLFERTRASGAIRPDLDVNDLSMVFEQLASVRIGDEARTSQLRHRYLALLLEAMRRPSNPPLPGPPPTWPELHARW
jgi:hypothetical protein